MSLSHSYVLIIVLSNVIELDGKVVMNYE